MKTKKLMRAFTLLCLVLFLSNPAPAVLITINYKIPCESAVQTMTLGDFTATPHDGTDKWMEAIFTVASDAQKGKPGSHGIWNCMNLHWLQTVWHIDMKPRPTFGGGKTWDPPIIDPPKGGWDPPTQPAGDDDQPWYWRATEEQTENVEGVSYHFSDNAADLTAPDYLGFSTYLVVVATQTCQPRPPECLGLNEILVLGGFDWTINSALINVQLTFSQPTAGDLAEISVALSTAAFSGWSVVGGKAICCIPEPITVLLLGLGGLVMLRRRTRAT